MRSEQFRSGGGSVAGVILAAGSSTRLGENKLFLQIDGESLLRRAVKVAADAGLDPILVVLGHESGRAANELAGLACRPVLNARHADGQATSFRAGIGAVPASAPAAVVLLADMPFVTSEMVSALVARYRSAPAPLVVSEYGGVQAPPTLYDRSLFSEIGAMTDEGSGQQIVRRHREEAEAVTWPADRLADVDTPADREKLLGVEDG